MSASLRCAWQALQFLLLAGVAFLPIPPLVDGAFINFQNCLPPSLINSNPRQLQWTPLFVDAKFDRSSPYNLSVTLYGNVTGQQVEGTYPPPSDPSWKDNNSAFGKIANIGSAQNYSTLLADFKVLDYDAYNAKATEFCPTLVNGTCPLGPYFYANASDPYDLPAFSLSHDFGAAYEFSTLAATIRVLSGDIGAPDVLCVSTNITPDLGSGITSLLTWLPAAILILKGVATLSAAIWSPWGSSDIFRWSSNYGRDEDQLRLVTPGFGDCLQYIQFITLTGALSVQYPGFYQPAVSQTAWSLLLFNQSFVTNGNGTQSLQDGIYTYNGTYGMTAMSQLIGMTSTKDIWACMAIWLLVIAGALVLLCQLGFFARWIYRRATDTTEEDLRQKNLPFTLGNMIRLLFNYFILPIVALSLFQLVIAPISPTSVVVCAVILLIIMIASAGWILRVIFTTKPRTILFDDMPTVLMYGPLYNTYSDSAAPFALVPVFITFMRGVALGAVQPSGIGQIIVLAICEVIFILTLNGFRPFQNQTSMNAYHTSFAAVRLITVLLSIAFVETLGVTEAPKGWIGYAILLLHACVLVFGFFLNAAQTLVEVVARSMGVAGDAQTGAIRGSILNLRMLKKRRDRPATGDRGSMTSNAAILQDNDTRSAYAGGRSRSMSASSQQLLNQMGPSNPPSVNRTSGYENFANGDFVSSPSADTETGQGGFSFLPGANGQAQNGKPKLDVKGAEGAEIFYRPPRPRRTTNDELTPGAKTRSGVPGDFPYQDSPDTPGHARQSSYESGFFGRDSPAPAYFRERADSNENLPRPDYAVREVDQYYRGPALSDLPTRKLKTGPADPEGPAASAQSWFQRLVFGVKGKQKEPSKGFEVVRSSRMPREMQGEDVEMQTSPSMNQEPYRDSPPMARQNDLQAGAGAERSLDMPDQEAPRTQPAFKFGLDGAGDEPKRQDSGRNAGVYTRDFGPNNSALGVSTLPRPSYDTGASGSIHPGLRAEQRRERSQDTQDVTRPSQESGSDYDRPRSEIGDGASSHYRISDAPTLDPIESVGAFNMPSRFNSGRSRQSDAADIGNDWVRAVDNLSWNHERSPPTSAGGGARQLSGGSNAGFRTVPSVPRRSSRRTPSQDQVPQMLPVAEGAHEDVFEGFDSGRLPSPDFLGPPQQELERPSSFASVSHHRAADSISRNSFGASAALQGTSAEIFGRNPEDGPFHQGH